MNRDGVVQYLHTDHLGSTSLATNSSGAEVIGSRTLYYPYGEERWSASGGTLATDYGFTGQRREGFGLMDYNARFYDPYLNRFISPDTIVPDPANPQSFNRYSYVLNNPLRYVDPSGYYSEEEIMTAFDVSMWDEVLAYFEADGALEGRWGWLEILRRAEDGWRVEDSSGYATLLPPMLKGNFSRNDEGKILVGGKSHTDFALQSDEYTLRKKRSILPGHSDYTSNYTFHTFAGERYFHRKIDWSRVDWVGMSFDVAGIVVDGLTLGAAGRGVNTLELHWREVGAHIDGASLTVAPFLMLGSDDLTMDAMGVALDAAGLVSPVPFVCDGAGIALNLYQASYLTP